MPDGKRRSARAPPAAARQPGAGRIASSPRSSEPLGPRAGRLPRSPGKQRAPNLRSKGARRGRSAPTHPPTRLPQPGETTAGLGEAQCHITRLQVNKGRMSPGHRRNLLSGLGLGGMCIQRGFRESSPPPAFPTPSLLGALHTTASPAFPSGSIFPGPTGGRRGI